MHDRGTGRELRAAPSPTTADRHDSEARGSGSSMIHRLSELTNTPSNCARVSSGSSTRMQASGSSRFTFEKKRIAARCRTCTSAESCRPERRHRILYLARIRKSRVHLSGDSRRPNSQPPAQSSSRRPFGSTRAIAWSNVCSRDGESRYITCSAGASNPVSRHVAHDQHA